MEENTGATKLPDKPSALIRVGLADLKAIGETPGYQIDFMTWHNPAQEGDTCLVCLAGAVMARSLGAERGTTTGPGDFEDTERTHQKLLALESFRYGEAATGMAHALGYGDRDWEEFDRHVTAFEHSPGGFYADMERLAQDLEDAGY